MKNINHFVLTSVFLLVIFFSCHPKTNPLSEKVVDTLKQRADSMNQTPDSSTADPGKEKPDSATLWITNQSESKINFTIKNFGNDVHGTLGGLKATIQFDQDNPEGSRFSASVKVSTINTGSKKRDKDLMHPKYFDEEKYPEISFKSDKVTKSGNGFVAHGHLTIKGKSLPKEIPFTFEEKGNSGVFKSQFTLERLDYGIGGTGPIMGKDVDVSLEVIAGRK